MMKKETSKLEKSRKKRKNKKKTRNKGRKKKKNEKILYKRKRISFQNNDRGQS